MVTVPPPPLPFAALNLRRNPFGEPDPASAHALAVVDVEPLSAFLEDGGSGAGRGADPHPPGPGYGRVGSGPAPGLRAVQLLGPPGAGKTTWLRALGRAVDGTRLWAWSADDGWPPPPPGRVLLVDDAHLLGDRFGRHVLGRPRVVLASHRDLGTELRGGGYRVRTLRVPERMDPARLRRIVERRLEAARRGPGPLPQPGDALLLRLLARHGTDLRALLGALYDWAQGLEATVGRAAEEAP